MLVCRTWHDLIVASPRYWTTVNIWVYEPVDSSPRETERSPKREPEEITLERRLKRTSDRPFEVNVESSSDVDLEPIFNCLRSQEHRLQALNLFPTQSLATVYESQLTSLFNTPLPGLTSLCVGPFCTWMDTRIWDSDNRIRGTWFQVNAPNLCELSFVNTERLEPGLGNIRVELGGLVELRICGCDVMSILSIFSTPTLCRLVVHGDRGSSRPLGFLPQYRHLKEPQWDDNGPYETFNTLASLCPNITSFANYVVGLEEQERIRQDQRGFPPPLLLEEILLSSATSPEIAQLIDALMERLRERVNIALWLEPWSDSRSLSDRD